MFAQCNVSKPPYSMETVSAGDVAAALRLVMDIAPPVDPSRYGHGDGPVFRRHQRAAIKNGCGDWTLPDDDDDRVSVGACALNSESRVSLADFPCSDTLEGDGSPFGFKIQAPEETALALDHGPWSMGFHAIPPRSGRNLDHEKRSRANLREQCRHDPSVFARAIPADAWSRVTVSDKLAEANALLDAVDDRPWHEWLTAPVDEPVVVNGYRAPKPRLRGRLLPGMAITGADDGVLLVLLDKDRAPPPYAGPRNRRAH